MKKKTLFITGGSTGIGAASVVKFISEGWNVGFMDIKVPAAEELQKRVHEPERLLFCEGNTRRGDRNDLLPCLGRIELLHRRTLFGRRRIGGTVKGKYVIYE